ncbi:MAG: amidinotransferase [Candidatus Rokuibacteriota bacterium]|nr:MAG: amidinotransferase [Candidatus Rokubacteria bacterium]
MSLKDSGQYYHEVLKRIPPRAFPVFEDPGMQERVWGRRWGVYHDVGTLRLVLVHRPGDEVRLMTADRYDPGIEALIDDDAQWYWRGDRAPDLPKMQAEHDALVAALQREGVEVVHVDGAPTDPKAMFTRDTGVVLQGGVVICRMGPVGRAPGTGRRGEEAFVTRRLAALGMPILRTIHGSGLFEGGSFTLLNQTTAAAGLSYRQNEEAARQLEEVLAVQGTRLLRVPLAGHALHLDGQLVMVDHDLALVNVERTPYWFLDTLRELKIRVVELHHADNPRVLNCLAVRPGKVLLAVNNGDATAERLVDHGVEVVPLDYAECQQNGGGLHCSTLPLVRERD